MISSNENLLISQRLKWPLLVGVFLTSSSLLAFQISITRLLSVMLTYHYVFLVISLALLGLGTGGIFIHVIGRWISIVHKSAAIVVISGILYSLSLPLSVIVLTRMDAGTTSILFYGLIFLFANDVFHCRFLPIPLLFVLIEF